MLNWLRKGKGSKVDTTGDFAKVEQLLPKKKGQKPEDRAKDIESVLDWMRNKDLSPGDVADRAADTAWRMSIPS